MNFFQSQDRARRRTGLLLVLMVAAVAGIAAALYVVVLVTVRLFMIDPRFARNVPPFHWFQPTYAIYTLGGTLLVVLVGSYMRIRELAGGGSTVALLMGGRFVKPNTGDADERRLLNVVEEMSIASGVPVPQVYQLEEEDGINAFAAGHTLDDTAIAATRGTLKLLNRDELQGVVAHEFSHILNGDMRLNIRLIGLIHGIICIALAGRLLLEAVGRAGRVSTNKRGAAGAVVAALVLGLTLWLIGSIGELVGRLIQCAVSRQREFLADAAAVQFTRNPQGIGNALKKIGGYRGGSRLHSSQAEAVSHLLFADGLVRCFFNAFSTHPPLDERIRRIDPSFDGTYPQVSPLARPTASAESVEGPAAPGPVPISIDPAAIVAQIGMLNASQINLGAALLNSIADDVRTAVREPPGAVAAICALLLSTDESVRARQIELVRAAGEPAVVADFEHLAVPLRNLDARLRLPVVDLAVPALRRLGCDQFGGFAELVERLIRSDGKLTIFEFALAAVVRHRIRPMTAPAGRREVEFYSYRPLVDDGNVLLSVLARLDPDENAAAQAFRNGAARLPKTSGEVRLLPAEQCRLDAVDQALGRLSGASPKIKERLIDAAAHCVLADRTVTLKESELLRAVAVTLGCPIPPFLPAVPDDDSANGRDA